MSSSSDEEIDTVEDFNNKETIEDILILEQNYNSMWSENISKPVLTKYEKTKIIAERTQQLSNGAVSFLKNPESYGNIFDIAIEELKQKKLPFILKRPVANKYEYWKLSDLSI
jgi:DNA-directed RNA polymerase subunit K/omega